MSTLTFQIDQFIQSKQLFDTQKERLLLAVSGGPDSMALLHLFNSLKFQFEVAHCNFKLRGKLANNEEEFVSQTCKRLNIPFHVKRFETKSYAKKKQLSTQMAARELRYEWFHQLLLEKDLHYIVTAHHQYDQTETIILNLIKGTGILGLSGMKIKTHKILKPLLPFSKKQLIDYLHTNQFAYKTDASNLENTYLRNRIRNILIPEMLKINPSLHQTISTNSSFIANDHLILKNHTQELFNNLFKNVQEQFIASKKELKKLHPLPNYLYHFLSPFGFQETTQIATCINRQSETKRFYSSSHSLVIDRNHITLSPTNNSLNSQEEKHYTINNFESPIVHPIKINHSTAPNLPDYDFSPNKTIAYFDADKIQLPLYIRHRQDGDTFAPFGLSGKKKRLSRFFIDQKFSQSQKNSCWLLLSNNQIIWVIGHRTSHHYSVTPNTKTILKLELTPSSLQSPLPEPE